LNNRSGEADGSWRVVLPLKKIFLTSGDFVLGLHCPKHLYLEIRRPDLGPDVSPFRSGLKTEHFFLRQLAAGLYPGGRWADEGGLSRSAAAVRTEALIGDPAVPAVFGAVFEYKGLSPEIDLLGRNRDGSWDLALLRTGAWLKTRYLWDLAFCRSVLDQLGLEVRHAYLMSLNDQYRRPVNDRHPETLFQQTDCTDRTVDLLESTPQLAGQMLELLGREREPVVSLGRHCREPRPCPYERYCDRNRPLHWVGDFYRMSGARKKKLLERGVRDIREIPDDEPLTPLQSRIKNVLVAGRLFVDPKLTARLLKLPRPWHYLDFETVMPAAPLYPGAKPYEMVPFQWSLHTELEGQGLRHQSFLAEGADDPRPQFVRSLIRAVSPGGVILTYTNFESSVLRSLKGLLPEQADQLEALAGRCVDFCALIRRHVYHPDFGQSFSLKKVLPALVPDLAYDNLDIQEGETAGLAFLNMFYASSPRTKAEIRAALLDYCARDTLALVALKRFFLSEPKPF